MAPEVQTNQELKVQALQQEMDVDGFGNWKGIVEY